MITRTGGTERAMVVNGYTWTELPTPDYNVRVLTVQPVTPIVRRVRLRHVGEQSPPAGRKEGLHAAVELGHRAQRHHRRQGPRASVGDRNRSGMPAWPR